MKFNEHDLTPYTEAELEAFGPHRWEAIDKLLNRYCRSQPCQFCKRPSGPDAKCDGCWEVTRRLEGFLRDGGQKAREALIEALWPDPTKRPKV